MDTILLIEPFGIETRVRKRFGPIGNELLIEPFGIETQVVLHLNLKKVNF